MTMFIFYLSFPLASKFKLVLHPCTHLIKKTSTRISRLPFPVKAIVNLSVNKSIAPILKLLMQYSTFTHALTFVAGVKN